MNQGRIEQAVILAGGLGTRMKPFTDNHPKPMYRFQGTPFIEYLIKQVKSFGINKVLLLLGYLSEQIIDYLGNGEKYGISIEYSVTPVEYDTGNRLLAAKEQLQDEFLLLYCDNYCPIHFQKLCRDYFEHHADIQISAYSNKDFYTKSNLKMDSTGQVICYDKKRTLDNLQGVDIGYAIIHKKTLRYISETEGQPVNFEARVYPLLAEQGKLFATRTDHRYYSVGSWARIELTEKFFSNPGAVFLDRDGTLNVRPPKACYVETPEDFVWLDGAMEAIRILKEAGYQLILVSNQPGIARGNLTIETLERIHHKMQKELQEETGYEIDAIYYCPHNWEDGCECRKPKAGMLYQAQKDYFLDLTKCFMIGDDDRDIEAGTAAGCKCFKVTETNSLLEIAREIVKKGTI